MNHSLVYLLLFAFSSIVNGSMKFSSSDEVNRVRWADSPYYDMEILCDRVGLIVKQYPDTNVTEEGYLGTYRILAPAVLIDVYRSITSFNPFREAMNDTGKSKFTDAENPTIMYITHRTFSEGKRKAKYSFEHQNLVCGREVIPNVDDTIPWLGPQREFSPVHDLMVVRTNNPITRSVRSIPARSDFSAFTDDSRQQAGPIITKLAKPGDVLGRNVNFCSWGFRNEKDIENYAQMHGSNYDEDDNVVEDCDEWIPRDWGHHICIRNVKEDKALGSGAMLFHGDKLFGVGSFMVYKGQGRSVHVFTDVRPYDELIRDSCGMESMGINFFVCHAGFHPNN